VAYIAKSNSTGLDSIHLVPVFGTSSFANVISDNVHIKSMRFAGNRYVVYTCVDENNHVRLKSANLKSKERKDISPVENAHFIRVIAMGESGIITLSHDGNDYITNRVNVSNGSSIQIKKDRLPFAAIFDENLAPQLWYKNITEQSVDVFINDGTKNGRQIDQINPKEEKYIGKFGSKCFKLRIRRNGNESEVDLLSLNLADNSQHTTVIKDIQEVSDCNVQFNASGDPLLINVNKGRITNSAIHASADRHINHLNRTLSEDWRIVDATTNGDKWLVCASDPQKSNEYWYYDTTNMRAKRVVVANEALSNERKLRPVDYVKIPSRDGSYIRGYLIKNLNHSIQSPLVIITNSKRFSWEFAPLAQFIANRGCAVLCLNCRPDYDGAGNDEESRREASDIIEATEWCFKNKIALVGHVSILGREKGALFAIDAFLKHQKYFAGCVLLSPTFSDEDNPLFHGNTLNRLEKPLCVIGHINDAGQFADSSFAEKMGHLISYLAYHQKPGNDLMAGLVEKCISVLHKNVYAEKMSAKSMSSFNSLVDGLGILTDKKVDEDTSIGESKSAYDML
jgi:hypothetical protein